MKKIMLFVLVLTLSAMMAWGQGNRGPMQGRAGLGMMGGICPANALAFMPSTAVQSNAERLGLTADQVTSLKSVLVKSEETLRPLLQKSSEATQALRAALVAPEYNATNVTKLAQDAVTAETAIISTRLSTWTQVRAILTPEQVTKLAGMIQRKNPTRPSSKPTTEEMPPPPTAPSE